MQASHIYIATLMPTLSVGQKNNDLPYLTGLRYFHYQGVFWSGCDFLLNLYVRYTYVLYSRTLLRAALMSLPDCYACFCLTGNRLFKYLALKLLFPL